MSQDLGNVPKLIQSNFQYVTPVVHEDVDDILAKGPVPASSIEAVILSHVHFDHIGDCTKFPEAEIITGPGSRAATGVGFPIDPNSPFESAVVNHPRYHELSFEKDTWTPIGPFDRAYDFFGDQSLYLVDAPGHMAGHLGALVKTGSSEWVFIGGDCCHHRSILQDSRPMSLTMGPGGKSFHSNPAQASKTIERVRLLERTGHVFVALAHDHYLVGRMPEYPTPLNGWKESEWKKQLDIVLSQDYKKH